MFCRFFIPWKDEEAALVDKVACQLQEHKENLRAGYFEDPKGYQQAFSNGPARRQKLNSTEW